ncbi:MAG: MFS transporter [Gemmatimonadales bacterium]
MSEAQRSRPELLRASWALILLATINLLNYLDRNIIFALFEPIKNELSLNDTQLGWLGSAYILVFSVSALPFGVIGDLKNRKTVIAAGTAMFSAFTSLGGLVRGFVGLFVTRAAVGIGEAAYAPASMSMVADYFPGKHRAFAMGVFNAGVPIGGVLGIVIGGYLSGFYGWRVAMLTAGIPGFACAALVMGLRDPTRKEVRRTIRGTLRALGVGALVMVQQLSPALVFTAIGLVSAVMLTHRYGIESPADTIVLAGTIAIGVALTIARWVRLVHLDRRGETPFTEELEDAVGGLLHAGRTVLRTPTLVFIFISGALVSFGTNGLVGWGPSLMTRKFGLSIEAAAEILGLWGLVAGVFGTLAGGLIADWLRRWTDKGRVITVAAGFIIGGPIGVWTLAQSNLRVFVPGFMVGFFFLSWYNGPLSAVIFDVVPAKIGSTVVGAYLLFIHLAGDAIAFPLIGALSDRIKLERAVMLLPLVALAGGIVALGALPTLTRDAARLQSRGAPPGS